MVVLLGIPCRHLKLDSAPLRRRLDQNSGRLPAMTKVSFAHATRWQEHLLLPNQ